MSAHFRALFIAASLLALLTALNAVFVQRTDVSIALGIIGIGLLCFGLGLGVRPRPSPRGEPAAAMAPPPVTTPQVHAAAPPGDAESQTPEMNGAVIAFAQELMAATTMERFRGVISTHLPMLLGTRRVWIATRSRRGREVIVPEKSDGTQPEDLLDADGRDWTTFALRVDNESVGVLGIEGDGGVKPRVRRLVQIVAPMIAQAMTTAQTVDTMVETSLVDLLTGLATRQEGMTRLETEIKRAQRSGATMAVLMLDLDQFKSINDRFGHAVGDAMLGAVGRTILRTLRASDIRVRWGGEEFLIVLPETDLPRAQVVANGLLREIASATVATPDGPTGSTVSIGITISRPGETDAAAMIRRADMALYHAKAAGRACVRVVMGDRTGQPVPASSGNLAPSGPAAAHAGTHTHRSSSLPSSDKRNPNRSDRRRVPSPGRRSTDPQTAAASARNVESGAIPSMRS
jgi:diguanylate cyclase (GGDEF)-like protein